MLFWCVVLLVIDVPDKGSELDASSSIGALRAIDELEVADFGDGQHRGYKWYDLGSSEDQSDLKSAISSESSLSTSSISNSFSSGASSAETKERRRATQAHRNCIPCPYDMLKAHNNIGIKWICAGYQRARRSFKSECMMRYRNCQDGTLFVKLTDHRCKNDTYHGKHWFYDYKV